MKTMKCFAAVIMMAMVFVVTGITAKAAGLSQTAATKDSATITWNAETSSYMQGWILYVDGQPIQLDKATTSYTIQGLAQGKAYIVNLKSVYVSDASAQPTYNDEGVKLVRTTPNKVKTTDVIWSKNDYIELLAIDSDIYLYDGNSYLYADGFEIQIKDVKGKTKKKFDSNNRTYYGGAHEYFSAPGALKNKGMQYVVKPYITLDNGQKVYGDAITKVIIPQAKITKLKSVSKSSIKLTWKKVSGAKSYTIYRTTNSGKKFKKVKTVSAKTTSYTVSRKYLESSGNKNGICIVANKVKVGKKKYNSTKSYYTYTY